MRTTSTRSLARPSWVLLCTVALISLQFLGFPQQGHSQRTYPLLGQEADSPPLPVGSETGKAPKVDIVTSALLERVLAFNVLENTYSAVWWVVLTWKDANAGRLVTSRTGAVLAGTATCGRSCDGSSLPSGGCCDTIWLPQVEMPNLVAYHEDQQPRFRINANATSGVVTWSTRIVGTWYTPLDFRAYPFDHQHLLMQLAIADSQSTEVGLRWEHVAKLNNTAHTKGSDMSGWRVKWGKGKVYDSRHCYTRYNVTAPLYQVAAANSSSTDFSAAAAAAAAAVYRSVALADRYFASNLGKGTTEPPDCGTYAAVYDEARALYGPVVLVADIMVKRVSSYYVMTNLLPVLIISLVVFVVFYMPCNALSDRMVVIMTLFLSLTALQFVFEFPPANYMNALQQVVLVAYVMMLIACIESLVVSHIAILPQQLTNTRNCLTKYSKLFRRVHLVSKLGSVASARATADHPGAAAAAATPLSGSPRLRIPTRTTSIQRTGSRRGAATPPLTAVGARGSATLSRAARQAMLSRLGQHAALPTVPGTPTPATACQVAPSPPSVGGTGVAAGPEMSGGSAAGVGAGRAGSALMAAAPADLAVLSVRGSDAGAEGSGGGAKEDTALRINIHASKPSASSSRPSACQSPCALFDGHVRQEQLFSEALADRPTPPTLVRPPSRFAEWLYAAWLSLRLWVLTLVQAPGNFYNHCKDDADFAWFIACRIDKWCCLVCLVLYSVCVAVLLWVQTQVGDHKLMLGDRPGNM